MDGVLPSVVSPPPCVSVMCVYVSIPYHLPDFLTTYASSTNQPFLHETLVHPSRLNQIIQSPTSVQFSLVYCHSNILKT